MAALISTPQAGRGAANLMEIAMSNQPGLRPGYTRICSRAYADKVVEGMQMYRVLYTDLLPNADAHHGTYFTFRPQPSFQLPVAEIEALLAK